MSAENSNGSCDCGAAYKVIFSCSGGSDTGEITDRAARKLTRDGIGKMSCMAGIGGRVNMIMVTASDAGKIIAIDGCPQDCAKKTLELAGFTGFGHLRVTDLGLQKGKSPATDTNIDIVVEKAKELL